MVLSNYFGSMAVSVIKSSQYMAISRLRNTVVAAASRAGENCHTEDGGMIGVVAQKQTFPTFKNDHTYYEDWFLFSH